jgi:hypothetical protein
MLSSRIFIFLAFLSLSTAQDFCLSDEPLEFYEGGVGNINIGGEVNSSAVNCVQRLLVPQGQKTVAFQTVEYRVSDHPICIEETPNFPGYCSTEYSLSILPGSASGGASVDIVGSADGLGAPAGGWVSVTPPGAVANWWRRVTTKAYDVSSCTAVQDCEMSVSMIYSGSQTGEAQQIQVYYNGRFRIRLTNTPWSFVPVDSRETIQLEGSSASGKHVSFNASIFEEPYLGGTDPDVVLNPQVQFELSFPDGVSTYRKGTSSNIGTDVDTSPDYVFLPSMNPGLSISDLTAEGIAFLGSADVTVSSRDYGGVAILRAKMRIGEEWFYAENDQPVDGNENPVPASTCAVASNDPRGFVQIPIDTDCNWIADSWEKTKAVDSQFPSPGHFPKYWDGEKTSSASETSVVLGEALQDF